jgi:hypothetical protein
VSLLWLFWPPPHPPEGERSKARTNGSSPRLIGPRGLTGRARLLRPEAWTLSPRMTGARRGGVAARGSSSPLSARGRRWCSASPTSSPWTSPPTPCSPRAPPRPWSTPSARCPTSPRAATPCTSTSARSPRTGQYSAVMTKNNNVLLL